LLELALLKSYREKPHGEIVEAIAAQNFDLADRLIAAADDADATTLADLHIFSDAQRQQYFVSTGNADENICRMYNACFEKRRLAFQPLWWRLSYRTSRAACFQVVRDPKCETIVRYLAYAAHWKSLTASMAGPPTYMCLCSSQVRLEANAPDER